VQNFNHEQSHLAPLTRRSAVAIHSVRDSRTRDENADMSNVKGGRSKILLPSNPRFSTIVLSASELIGTKPLIRDGNPC